MKNKVIFLRISYWFGAILDGVMVFPMLFPIIGGKIFGIENFNPGNDYKYAMMVGASLMLGWTVLLVWADRKPVERKGIILITIIPVAIGMILAGVFAVTVDLIHWQNMLPTWIIQLLLLIVFFTVISLILRKRIKMALMANKRHAPDGQGRGGLSFHLNSCV